MKDADAKALCLVLSYVLAPWPQLAELLRRLALDEYLAKRIQWRARGATP